MKFLEAFVWENNKNVGVKKSFDLLTLGIITK